LANYSADVRIGVVGQSKLSSLQKQLDKVNASVNKLNKALVLKTRAQTIKLNTKGANAAIKQLEDRINKLGRTITVNVRTNEKKGDSSGKSTAAVISTGDSNKLATNLATGLALSKGITAEAEALATQVDKVNRVESEILAKNKELQEIYRRQAQVRNGFAEKGKSIKQSESNLANSARLREAAQKRRIAGFEEELRLLNQQSAAQRKLQRVEDARTKGLSFEQRLARNKQANKLRKGAGKGAFAAGALGLSSIPGLQGASQGALIGGGVGGAAGAAAGAAVGALTDLAGAAANYANQAAIAAAETAKFELALRGVTSGSDYTTALEDIAQLSDQFTQDLGTTTEQFTKLTAATTANGISIDETAEVYRGLAAANLALGGNSERLQGILLATSQVFSKGKVQAEELRGQIGERLPGAFALFAKAVGKTPAELDKALERGEVTVEDFVAFTKKLFEQFGENAQVIRDAPENAGARLEKALGDLQRNVGKLLAPIGAAFQNIFTGIANVINDAAIALNKFLGIGTDNALAKVNKQLAETAGKLGTNGGRRDGFYNERIGELLKEQARLNDLKKGLAEPPTKPVSSLDGGGGSGSGKGSKSGPADTTAQTRVELQLQQELLRIEQERFALVGKEASIQDFDLQREQLKAGLAASLQKIDQDNITAASKIAEKELERVKYATDLQAIKNAEKEFTTEQTKAFEEQVLELQNAIELESQITDEKKRQVELTQALAEIEGSNLSPERKEKLASLQTELSRLQSNNANPINQYFNQLQEEIGNTDQMIVDLARTVESELSTAMSSALTGLVDGTKTAQEAFADMFAGIGKAFIDMATKMIAKALMMKALGILTGGSGGGGGGMFNSVSEIGGGGMISPFAEGGRPPVGQTSLIGERGPELFVPDGPGTVLSYQDSKAALSNYNRMSPDEQKAADKGEDPLGGGAATAMQPIQMDTRVINGVEYATVKQMQEAAQFAAAEGAKQGAKIGEAQTLRRLRMNPSARRQVGL
jgi:tape measure domain-containing protein